MASLLDHNVADPTEKKIEKNFAVKIVFGLSSLEHAWVDQN